MRALRYSTAWVRLIALALMALVLVACGGGGGGAAACRNASSTSTPAYSTYVPNQPNAVELIVDNGPPCSGPNVNRLYTSVTICKPGTSTCQTIDHVLVDTGSTGLRLLKSAAITALNLNTVSAPSGQPLFNCVQFVDNTYAFGKVARAKVILGPQTAPDLPIQIMADFPTATTTPLDSLCAGSTSGNELYSVAELGAKGILGVGLDEHDCPITSDCVGLSSNGYYYTCAVDGSNNCTAPTQSTALLADQLTNPVVELLDGSGLRTDNNGVIIDLPAVTAPGTTSISGQMLFGIDTRSNNTTSARTRLNADAYGNIATVLSGSSINSGFIDSGSNGLFFDIPSLTTQTCSGESSAWYCPLSSTSFTATLSGSVSVPFTVGNALSLFSTQYAVLPTLAGPIGDNTSFDWGLPFFYGRKVFFGIEGHSNLLGPGPMYAF